MSAGASRPRAVFFGSPEFAVPFLDIVAQRTQLCAVVSQPDRPAGRGKHLAEPAVKVAARRLGAPVLQPEKIRTPDFEAALRGYAADVFIVVAYGRILPQALLDIPRLGPWNVHASLLPRLRGAAPVQWAIIRGDPRTGVAVMRMEAGLDTGPVAAVAETAIGDDETAGQLFPRLARLGADLLSETLPRILDGTVALSLQDDALATVAPLLKKEDGRLDFTRTAREVSARARGVDPWPGATALLDGEPVKLFQPVDDTSMSVSMSAPAEPGRVLGVVAQGLAVACADRPIAFAELQLPGRKRLPAAAVVAGRAIPVGTRLDPG